MGKLKIKLLASQGTPAIVYEEGVRRIEKLFFQGCYELVEENPDVCFFLQEELNMQRFIRFLSGIIMCL